MSRRKLSPRDLATLNREAPAGLRYPLGGGPAELRMFGAKEAQRRRKKSDKGGKGCWRPSSWWGSPRACARPRRKGGVVPR
jgi:hypothetical protein